MKSFSIGTWICSYNTINLEILLKSNKFDWFTVDLEHSALNSSECFDIISFIQSNKKDCFVRMNDLNKAEIKKILDFGVNGLILPMVKDENDLKNIIDAAFYPPVGSRGTGLFRAQEHGNFFEEYVSNSFNDTKIILQIEHIDAINNLEIFLKNEHVHGFIIGPYDLSASLGKPGDFHCEDFKNAIAKFETLCLNSPKHVGYHIPFLDFDKLIELKDKGYNFIGYSTDVIMFQSQVNSIAIDLNKI